MYFKDIDIILYVYDITKRVSFDHLKDFWISYAAEQPTPGHYVKMEESLEGRAYQAVLVGNKTDLNDNRTVSAREGARLAKSIGIPFVETSALDGSNVDMVWDMIIKLLQNIPVDAGTGSILETIVLKPIEKVRETFETFETCNC